MPGEKTSPTQPFPLKPAPLARIDFKMSEIDTVTPEVEAACRKLIADNNIEIGLGPYAPPAYNHLRVIFPSEIGGADWGGASFNPDLGYLFINVNDLGQINGLKDPAGGPVNLDTLAGTNNPGGRTGPYTDVRPSGRFRDSVTQLPCNQPPWGEMVAVNVNTGDIAWRVPLGVTDSLPADRQNTGRPGQGGPSPRRAVWSLREWRTIRVSVPWTPYGQGNLDREAGRVGRSPCPPPIWARTASNMWSSPVWAAAMRRPPWPPMRLPLLP